MKKIIAILVLFISVHQINAQKEICPTISIAETVSTVGFYNTTLTGDHNPTDEDLKYFSTGRSFTTTSFAFGIYLKTKIVDWKIAIDNQVLMMRNDNKIGLASYLLGVNFECRFLNNKVIRPLLALSLSSEIATNYKGKYLNSLYYDPVSYNVNLKAPVYIHSNVYLGTPFMLHSFLGVNLNVSKKITLNFLIGYGCRILKGAKVLNTFNSNYSTSHPVKTEYIGNVFYAPFHMIDFQFGLNYSFSFKKKPKTDTP